MFLTHAACSQFTNKTTGTSWARPPRAGRLCLRYLAQRGVGDRVGLLLGLARSSQPGHPPCTWGYLTYALVPSNSLLHGPRDSQTLGLHPKAAGPGRGEASYMEGHVTGSSAGCIGAQQSREAGPRLRTSPRSEVLTAKEVEPRTRG